MEIEEDRLQRKWDTLQFGMNVARQVIQPDGPFHDTHFGTFGETDGRRLGDLQEQEINGAIREERQRERSCQQRWQNTSTTKKYFEFWPEPVKKMTNKTQEENSPASMTNSLQSMAVDTLQKRWT